MRVDAALTFSYEDSVVTQVKKLDSRFILIELKRRHSKEYTNDEISIVLHVNTVKELISKLCAETS